MSPARLTRSRLPVLAFAFLTLPCLASTADAQSQSQGIPWYTIPLPIPNGFVDVATGNVHLEIPLASIPERNGDPLVAKAIWDSSAYSLSFHNQFALTGPGWQVFTGNSHSGGGSFSTSSQDCSAYSPYTQGSVFLNYFSFADSHSTVHTLGGASDYTRQVMCTNPSTGQTYGTADDIPSLSASAADGSGYTFNVQNYTKFQVIAPDGTIVYDNGLGPYQQKFPVDTNGNYSSAGIGSQPDMLGRSPITFSPYQVGYICQTSSVTVGVHASDGSTNNYIFTCSQMSVSEIDISGTQQTGTVSFLTSIALPNGTQYSFTYDTGTTGNHLGSLLSVTLPTGGAVFFSVPSGSQTLTFGGNTWTLSFASSTPAYGQTTITVTSPPRYDSASHTNVSDKSVFVTVPGFHPYVQTAQYYSGSSTLLRTVSTTYSTDLLFLPLTVTTTLNDSGQSSSVSYQYYNNQLRNYPTQKQETDFTGAVVRTTTTTYNPNFMKPTSVNVYAGANTSGAPIASTLYAYDEYSSNYCKNGLPMLSSVTGATSHDDADFGASFTNRGNVTTIQRLISGTTYSTIHMCYDTLGNVTQTVDANGNPTTYDYSDSGKWADTSCVPSGTNTRAFPTTVTDALGHEDKYTYFTCTALKQSEADQNQINAGKNTAYAYDLFNRPTGVTYPDGGLTTYCYSDDLNSSCYTTTLPPFSTMSRLMTGSTYYTTKTSLDSYGRVTQTAITSDPDCSSGDKTDTSYDALGRVLSVSNPYCTAGEPTSGLTTYSYDALGRSTQLTHPDGASITTSYLGSATQVQDEGNGTSNVTRIAQSDAFGRLASVCEVAPGPFTGPGGASSPSLIGSAGSPAPCGLLISGTGFLTTYQYDALDNLLQVNQSGLSPRMFAYDSLSRLTSSINPESNTVTTPSVATVPTTYSYDANGNLTAKTAPAPNQTGAATVTTTYQYDALNRLTQESYSDGTTPTALYYYDGAFWGGTSSSRQNPIGRMTAWGVNAPPCLAMLYDYDVMGRTTQRYEYQTSNCSSGHPMQNTYDLMGNILTQTDGQWDTTVYTYNPAGRLLTATEYGANGGTDTLLSNAHYDAFGHLVSDTTGYSEVESYTYDNRGRQVTSNTTYNGWPVYSFNISSFAPDGNVLAANDSSNGNWTYSYDQFNRLVGANKNNGAGVYSYVYDRFGNRWQQNGPQSFVATFTGNNPSSPVNNNRIDGYTYDSAGNLIADGSHTYTYDAENRLISVDNGNTSTFTYDGEGRRFSKTNSSSINSGGGTPDPTGTTEFVYDAQGRLVHTENSIGNGWRAEIWAGNRHLATYTGPNPVFHHTDWLGTLRNDDLPNSNAPQYPWNENYSSLPFGDWFDNTLGLSPDNSPLNFTGQYHDFETDLDYFGARYYASAAGRFMSPDPENAGASDDNPQTWDAYAYAIDDPINNTDPDGMDACDGRPMGNCVEVTATAPDDEITYSYNFGRLMMRKLADVAQRANDDLHYAWDWWRTSQLDTGCLGAATAAGAALGASRGVVAGPIVQGVLAIPTAGGTELAGGPLGGAAIGGFVGGIGGGAAGYLAGQVACRTGAPGGGGGGGRAAGSSARLTRAQQRKTAEYLGMKEVKGVYSKGELVFERNGRYFSFSNTSHTAGEVFKEVDRNGNRIATTDLNFNRIAP